MQEHLTKYQGIKNVVLGCTHYPLIKEDIKNILGDVTFFDGSQSLAKHLKKVLEENNLLFKNNGLVEFIDSSQNINKERRFREILNK